MDLRLKFIGVNENDVIATSSLCSFPGTVDSFKYSNGTGGTWNYYVFKDEADRRCSGYYGGSDFNTVIIDVNGTNLGIIYPTVNQHYHYDDENNKLYECNNPSHYGTQN